MALEFRMGEILRRGAMYSTPGAPIVVQHHLICYVANVFSEGAGHVARSDCSLCRSRAWIQRRSEALGACNWQLRVCACRDTRQPEETMPLTSPRRSENPASAKIAKAVGCGPLF